MTETLDQKTILVTGATAGIGRETALALAYQGHHVLLHGRDPGKLEQTRADIFRATGNSGLETCLADFASLRQVRRMAQELNQRLERLDVLVNNAGLFMAERRLTEDGLECTLAVNHVATFLLTCLLLDLMKRSAPSRVVTVSSRAHQRLNRVDFDNLQGEKYFSGVYAYALSKLGNILFTGELARRLQGSYVTANCLHPGTVNTRLLHDSFGRALPVPGTPEQGADTVIYLAVHPEVEGVSGQYFISRRASLPSTLALNAPLQRRFWQESARLAGLEAET